MSRLGRVIGHKLQAKVEQAMANPEIRARVQEQHRAMDLTRPSSTSLRCAPISSPTAHFGF
ncbi:MAG TPA: hypothetical protein VGL69_10720 [Solirubrobacteraceae bacterium]|jgi:hypothetical protein